MLLKHCYSKSKKDLDKEVLMPHVWNGFCLVWEDEEEEEEEEEE